MDDCRVRSNYASDLATLAQVMESDLQRLDANYEALVDEVLTLLEKKRLMEAEIERIKRDWITMAWDGECP